MKKYRVHLIVFIFLTVLVIFLHERKRETTLGRGDTAISITGREKVSEISIADGDKQVKLTRENGQWMVNSRYEAREKAVDMILQTLERLRVSSPAPLSDREELLEKLRGESIRIDVHKGRRIRTYHLYSEDKSSPTYMIIDGSTQAFEAEVLGFSGHVASLFVSDEGYWRPNILFNYKPEDIAEVFVKHRDNQKGSFTLRQTPDNKISLYSYPDGDRLEGMSDSLAVRYLTNFFYVPYERFADSDEKMLMDSLVNARPDHIIRVTGHNGSGNEVFFHKIITENDSGMDSLQFDLFRLHALINNKREMIVVPYHSVDLILRSYSYFYQYPGSN